MPRPVAQQTGDLVNSDSFLDIVASVVSIMIIMVVLEGSRIKNTPVEVSIPAGPAVAELKKELANERTLRGDVLQSAEQIRDLEEQTAHRRDQRDILATMAAAVEHDIHRKRQKLDATKQSDFDLTRELSESQFQLEQLATQREQIEKTPTKPVIIESYPTPISRSVDGPEAHLLVANGRAVFVPLESLLEAFQSQAKRQAYRLRDEPELTDTVGPVGGFRLRYTLERHDVVPDQSGRGGSYARLKKWTLIPVANDLGEPARLALQQGSDFHRILAKILPGRTTITIWVYPNGFEAFREIRKALYRLDYTIAARPLPPGQSISGSPEGSKSASQ